MKNTFIGAPMERREDLRFLRGRGEYVDDVAMPALLYAVILRSSVAHGRLVSIDASAALNVPGVHSVITGADMPGGPPIIPMRLQPLPEFKPFEQPVIAHDKVRYVGEPIAVLLATSIGRPRRRIKVCCSRSPAPTARWCSRPARATPTLLSPTRRTPAVNIFAPAATMGSPWSRAA
jgi:xanthine dehydrogenase molybdopterin-binding subunit B